MTTLRLCSQCTQARGHYLLWRVSAANRYCLSCDVEKDLCWLFGTSVRKILVFYERMSQIASTGSHVLVQGGVHTPKRLEQAVEAYRDEYLAGNATLLVSKALSCSRDYSTPCSWPECPATSTFPGEPAEEIDEPIWRRSRKATIAIQPQPMMRAMRSSRPVGELGRMPF